MSVSAPASRSPVQLLPFYCPFEEAINPEFEAIERDCIEWIDRFHLYGDEVQRGRIIGTGAAEIYSRALPTAPAERVADVAKWLYWGFATDDLYYDNGPTSKRCADFLVLSASLVRIAEEPRARFPFELPYSDALRDLSAAILRHATPALRLDWAHTARAWFYGMAWDVANAERKQRPSMNDYMMMRMHTGGLASWATTLNIANGIELSSRQAADSRLRALTECWSTMCLFFNDLMSYAKETRNEDNSSNVISVLAEEHACSPAGAVPVAYAVCDRLACLFLGLRTQLLVSADDAMRTYIKGLEYTWRGILDWGFQAPRYRTGGDPNGKALQEFPGWTSAPRDSSFEPLPYPSVAWWWEELDPTATTS